VAHKLAIVRIFFFWNCWGGGHAATSAMVEVTLKMLCLKSKKLCCILSDNIFIIL